MAKKDLVVSLQYVIDTIRDALDKEAVKAAFFCALSIPDICAQIEFSNSQLKRMETGDRYIKWYDENIFAYENPPKGVAMNQLDGTVAYLIRCKMFHEGQLLHKHTLKKLENNYEELIKNDEKFKLSEIFFNFKFVTTDVESYSIGYASVDINNRPIGPITLNAEVDPKLLSQKLMWTAEGVIRNFNEKQKNNPTSIKR